jgi:hypothetical protein
MRYPKFSRTTLAKSWAPVGTFFSPSDAFYGAHGWLNAAPDPRQDIVRRPR